MNFSRSSIFAPIVAGAAIWITSYVATSWVKAADSETVDAQDAHSGEPSECVFFGPKRDHYLAAAWNRQRSGRGESPAGLLTRQVGMRLPAMKAGTARRSVDLTGDTIDAHVFNDLQARGIRPAESTNDFEFIRRVSLDLTGRIPTPAQVVRFVNDPNDSKRAVLIDQLLSSSQWVDKWTVFYSDLFKNTSTNSRITIFAEGRNAFYKWIHDSLANNKPYDQMATELIAATGTNNLDQNQGHLNFLILNNQTGGPIQDIYDTQAAGIAETFMGMSHMTCLLCHNGRGHLNSLSLWGSTFTRCQAWQFASFISHTAMPRNYTPDDPASTARSPNGIQYRSLLNSTTTDYALNTTTGNRPTRAPVNGCTNATVAPAYIDGSTVAKGSDYRAGLAKYITNDMQFSRAAVNYIWAHLFSVGIVDPPDQFDPARLDPNNPPPAPWTLQPSNPQLLDALARHFIASGYNIKALLREITNSQTYQLSSRYAGDWNPTWEPYFGRHLVRRLWAEELHDSVVIASGISPAYNVANFSNASTAYGVDYSPGFGLISYAMQLPDVKGLPDGVNGPVSKFLDAFLRGDRDLTPRKEEGSILQTLSLMNDPFVLYKARATQAPGAPGIEGSNLVAALKANPTDNAALVNQIYLTVLSRYATAKEMSVAMTSNENRTQAAEDLFWALLNKVDFVFNY